MLVAGHWKKENKSLRPGRLSRRDAFDEVVLSFFFFGGGVNLALTDLKDGRRENGFIKFFQDFTSFRFVYFFFFSFPFLFQLSIFCLAVL